ncbi:hypothetical protein Pla52n_41100 [Stieleria varia]|uniref:Uncharacterized protein n=1 Tax=Stieleria varia TaxID=2528005 RepID=A0A5C6AMV5_9BACT|nr:hypothetical protein Pla52n_41100 [Stieleria varia]
MRHPESSERNGDKVQVDCRSDDSRDAALRYIRRDMRGSALSGFVRIERQFAL